VGYCQDDIGHHHRSLIIIIKKISQNMKKFLFLFSFLTLFPFIASAAETIPTLITKLGSILNSIVPVLMGLGLIYFIWGVIKYVIAGGEEDKKKGKDIMVYGIIGFTVISAIWGIVNMVVAFLGGRGTQPVPAGGTCSAPQVGAALSSYLNYVTCIINNSVIPILFALATVLFIWGVIKFFFINVDEEAKRAQGKQFMIWGIVALAVMLSMWGLVNVLRTTFNINTGSVLPQVTPPSNNPNN
jgi:hypothetical protein